MKFKRLTIAFLACLSVFAQRKHTISGFLNSGLEDQIGLSHELIKETKFLGFNTSQIANLTIGYIDLYNIRYPELIQNGKGLIGQFGHRFYLNKQKTTRWYVQNSVSAGFIKFKGSYYFRDVKYNYDSMFRFISVFQPEIGHKFAIGRFSIDPAIGWQWNIELKSQGNLDNNIFDNTFIKAGIKAGYSF